MSTRRLVIAITFVALFAMAARVSMQNDTWYQLTSARWMVEHRQLLDVDLFSYTRYGQEWDYVQVNWLGQLLMYPFYVVGGAGGLNVFVALVVVLAYAILYPAIPGGAFLRAFALVLTATVAAVFWPARTNIFSFLFFAIHLRILEDWRWGRADRLKLLPLAQAVWANTHSASFAGIALAGLYGLAELLGWLWAGRGRYGKPWLTVGLRGNVGKFLLLGLALIVATCLTPLGPRTLLHPFDTIVVNFQYLTEEWQSLSPASWVFGPYMAVVALLLLGAALARGRLPLSHLLPLAFWGWQSALALRHVPFFALVALPALARLWWPPAQALAARVGFKPLVTEPDNLPPRLARLNIVLLALVSLAAAAKVALVLPEDVNAAALRTTAPYGAVDVMRARRLPGNLFNSFNFGGYLTWALPEMPVFADSRTDLFGDEVLDKLLILLHVADGWEDLMARWEINTVLVEPHWPLVAALKQQGWQVLYEDDVSILLTR
ncbi:MAG: hypothetical protein EPO32_10410 [Anaerolineae bacterium]|nr:MAG: hypothetical protein EPO32_10410 [Anaerolineae bacterium]